MGIISLAQGRRDALVVGFEFRLLSSARMGFVSLARMGFVSLAVGFNPGFFFLLLQQFDCLIQTPADVKKLEQSILQWAMMGRLVAQDANDEPADVLLERIAAEKARLVREKKIKKGRSYRR